MLNIVMFYILTTKRTELKFASHIVEKAKPNTNEVMFCYVLLCSGKNSVENSFSLTKQKKLNKIMHTKNGNSPNLLVALMGTTMADSNLQQIQTLKQVQVHPPCGTDLVLSLVSEIKTIKYKKNKKIQKKKQKKIHAH